jgi:hypothetical protein
MSTTTFTRMARVLLVLGIVVLASPAASAVAADTLTPARGDPENLLSGEPGGGRIADLTLQPEPPDEALDSGIVDIDSTLYQEPSVDEEVPSPPGAGFGLGLSLLLATSIVGYGVVFAVGMSRFARTAATHR